MDIRSLLQFLQVAKDGSYTKAAAALYLVQPTLSKTIHNLEYELGVPLFQKGRQHIELTDYGRKLVEIATPIVNDFQNIPQWLHAEDDLCSGSISIGATPMLASLYLASIISRFCGDYPLAELKLHERSTLDIYPIFTKEIVALIPKSSPLSARDSIKMADLREEKLNIYTHGHAIKDAIYSRCKDAGFLPTVNFTSNTTQLLIRLSDLGSGITILPKPFLFPAEYPNLATVPFDPVFPCLFPVLFLK